MLVKIPNFSSLGKVSNQPNKPYNLTIFLLGGDTLVHAATDPEIEGKGGLYFENSQVYTPKYFTRVLKNQGKLWNYSCEACSIEDFFEISGKA